MTYSTVRLCSGGGSFEAIPHPPLQLDLSALARRLEAEGVSVIDARVMLIAKLEQEVTIAQGGRILIKTHDQVQAERVLADVLRRFAIESPAAERPDRRTSRANQ
ncbi:MAG: hypothetical protein L3K04_07430 [Thermoplasmata archaeon]|nr:hypothetical protein [Thermoplasmata archaeon]